MNKKTIKRILLNVAALLLSVSATAGVVSKSQAETVARNVLGATSVKYVWNGLGDLKYGDVNPAYYVFNSGTAWAIISADDCATPVLMHGNGSFNPNDLPDNMRSLLGEIEDNIFTARSKKLTQAPEVKQAWMNYSGLTRAGSTPDQILLETASWNQGSPYNTYCPMDGSNRSVTGCVATAMAIVMHYYKWPQKGIGIIPGYTTYTQHITVDAKNIDGFEYDWNNMPLKYYSTSTDVQKEAVARLMEHCGAMVEMDYSADGSGAYSSAVAPAMQTYMSYSKSAKELYRYKYSNSDWFNMIKTEIDAGHPLIYGGQDINGNGGHQFVCDGYNSNNEVHINWGWGGAYNAWYAVCYLGPASGYIFSGSDSAIFGLAPDYSGTSADKPNLQIYSGPGVSLNQGPVAVGDFSLKLSKLICWDAYSGKLKAALFAKDGTVREYISLEHSISLPSSVLASDIILNCTITKAIHVGDYIGVVYNYTDDSGEKWEPIHILNTVTPAKLAALDITVVDIPSSLKADVNFYPTLLQGMTDIKTAIWYLDGSKITAEYVKMTAGKHTIKVNITYVDGSTETIVKVVDVN